MKTKLEFALGLARKAGAVVAGTEIVQDAIRKKKVRLVILASDASENTRKKITNSCRYYNTELFEVSLTMDRLSESVGISRLTSAVALTGHSVLRLVYDAVQAQHSQES